MGLIDLSQIGQEQGSKSTHTSAKAQVQAQFVAEARKGAIKETLAQLDDQHAILFTTKGAWSMHHLAEEIIQRAGKGSRLWITTYNFTRDAAETFARLQREGFVREISALLDHRMMGDENSAYALLRSFASKIGLGKVHAKILVVEGIDTYAVVGSANFTTNRRLEAGTLFKNSPAIDALTRYLNDEINAAATQ